MLYQLSYLAIQVASNTARLRAFLQAEQNVEYSTLNGVPLDEGVLVPRVSFVPVLAIAIVLAACSKDATPAAGPGAGASLPAMQQGAQTATPAAPAPAPAKAVPAQLPSVVARVNGDAISKTEFESAVQAIEQNRGPVPAERRDEVFRGLLDNMVSTKLLRQEALARKVAVSDADLDAHLTAIKAQLGSEDVFKQMLTARKQTADAFRAEQRTDLAVRKMLAETLKDKVTPTPDEISTFYKENLDRLKQPEQVRASHILVTVPQGADEATKAKSKARAADILKQAKAGKDFAALAKEHSQDPGSAVNGGDLGYFPQGQMVPAFNEVAFKLAPGAMSDLVETQFGFHIIKVVDKKAAHTMSLDEVREDLTKYLENQKRQRETTAFVAGLRAKGKVEILI
jgi:peptidyl-prolyl cis-trans isomerase C